MPAVRNTLETELRRIDDILLRLCELAELAVQHATTALTENDVALAQEVIDSEEEMTALHLELENRLLYVMARRAPVATDLRRLLSALRVGADLERMHGLARHIAKLARRRYPRCAVPTSARSTVLSMGRVAVRGVRLTRTLLIERDVTIVDEIIAEDDEMDCLHRSLLALMGGPQWEHGVEPAVDLTLINRFYERYGDHTVTIAQQMHFIVTGTYREPPPVAETRRCATSRGRFRRRAG